MANTYNKYQLKRTSVSSRTPNTTSTSNSSFLDTAELALNLTDKKMFSSNGTALFEIGANLSSINVTGNTIFGNTTINGFANITGTLAAGNTTITGRANVTTLNSGNVTVTGVANVTGNVSITDTMFGNNVILTGNLTVSGTTTYINTVTLNVGDNIVTLNADWPSITPTENAGIEVNRGSLANVQFVWDETNDRWTTNSQPMFVGGTLAAGNTTVTGFINVSSYGTFGGTVNATALNIGANVNVSTSLISVGNSTVNTQITAGNVFLNGSLMTVGNTTTNTTLNGSLFTIGNTTSNTSINNGTANVSTLLNIGANVNLTTTFITVGNSTVNAVHNQTNFVVGNTTVNTSISATAITSSATLGIGNTTVTGFANISSTLNVVGAATVNGALTVNNTAALGNTTVTGFANVSSTLNVVGAATVNGALTVNNTASVGNTTTTGFINVSSYGTFGGTVNATAINVGANVSVNTTTIFIGNTTVNTRITSSNYLFGASDTHGIGFYDSFANYSIAMRGQSTAQAGRLDTTSDYNMYFQMNGGTNRGFVFRGSGSASNGAVAQIDSTGNFYTLGGLYLGNTATNTVITTSLISIGNSTVNTQISAGNVFLNGSLLTVGNTTVNTSINNGTANVSTLLNVGANVNLSTTQLNVGNATVNAVMTSTSLVIANSANVTTNGHEFVLPSATGQFKISRDGFGATQGFNIQTSGSGNFITSNSTNSNSKSMIMDVVAGGNTIADTSFNVRVEGTTKLKANSTIVTITGAANVTGAFAVNNTTAFGNTTITGFANVSTTLNVVGAVTVNGALTVNNTAAVGNTTITGSANVSTTLNVVGAATVNGALTVNNTAALGNTTITGFANITSTANISGNVALGQSLDVTGNNTFRANTTFIGVNKNYAIWAGQTGTPVPDDRLNFKSVTGFARYWFDSASASGGTGFSIAEAGTERAFMGTGANTFGFVTYVPYNLSFRSANGTTETTMMLLDTNTMYVGIGTTTPSNKVDVVGNSDSNTGVATLRLFNANTTGNSVAQVLIQSGTGVQGGLYTFANTLYAGTVSAGGFNLVANNTIHTTIAANGNVGVGTTSPNAKLHVVGTVNLSSTVAIGGGLTVSNTAALGNTTITGSANVSTTLNVVGAATVNGALTINNTAALGNTTITGSANVSTTLNVVGAATVNGALTVNNTAALGNTTITGFANTSSLNVVGAAVVNGAFTVNNTASVGNTTITGFANVSSTLNVVGAATVNGALTVNNTAAFGNTTITGTLGTGNTTVTGSLTVTGNTTANNIRTTGSVQIDGNLTVSGNTISIGVTNLSISDNLISLNEPETVTVTTATSNATSFIYTANNGFNIGQVVTVSGMTPIGYNVTSNAVTFANATTFAVANTVAGPGAYVSGGTAAARVDTNPDIGFTGNYNDGTYRHAGFFRDATDGVFKVFDQYLPEPTGAFIDTSNTSFRIADFQSNNTVMGSANVAGIGRVGVGSANYIQIAGAASLGAPYILANGTDTDVPLMLASKNAGSILMKTVGGGPTQLSVSHTASAVNFLQVTGATTAGNPTITAQGSDANVGITMQTKGVNGFQFTANGSSIFTGNGGTHFRVRTDIATATNFWEVFGQAGGGGPILRSTATSGSIQTSGGTLSLQTDNSGTTQLSIAHTASAVNYVSVTGNVTGGSPYLLAAGTDTNIGMVAATKGSGAFAVWTNGGTTQQFNVAHTGSAVNFVQVTGGSVGTGVTVSAQGADSNVSMIVTTKGTGSTTIYTPTAVGGTATNARDIVNMQGLAGGNNLLLRVSLLRHTTGSDWTGVGYRLGHLVDVTAMSNIEFNPVGQAQGLAVNVAGNAPFQVKTSGGEQFRVLDTASAVNYLQVTGAATGGSVVLSAQGSDTNVPLNFQAKGSSYINTAGWMRVGIAAANYLQLQSAGAGGTPTITATGSDANVTLTITGKGGGGVVFDNPGYGNYFSAFPAGATTTNANHIRITAAATGSGPRLQAIGTDTNIDFNHYTAGTGAHVFYTNGNQQFRVADSGATSVNYVQVTGAATSGIPIIQATGSDTNVNFGISSKNAASVYFYTNNGAAQFEVVPTASAVNRLYVTGGATGVAPKLVATGSDANVSIAYTTKGTGNHTFSSGGGTILLLTDTPSAVNYVQVTGAATGSSLIISAQGSDTNIPLILRSKGAFATELQSSAGPVLFQALPVASSVNYFRTTPAIASSGPVLSAQGSDTNIDVNLTSKGTGAHIFNTGGGQQVRINDATTAGPYTLFSRDTFNNAQMITAANTANMYIQATGGGAIRFNTVVGSETQVTIDRTVSAVNFLRFTGSATGSAVSVSVLGSDSNVGVSFAGKGSGTLNLNSNTTFNANTLLFTGSNTSITLRVADNGVLSFEGGAVTFSNTIAVTGTATFSNTIVANGALTLSSTGAALILSNTSSAFINFGAGGYAAPSVGTRSTGAKIVLFNTLSVTAADYAIGVEGAHMWFGTDSLVSGYKWYANTTNTMTSNTTGLNIQSGGLIINGTSAIDSNRNGSFANVTIAGNLTVSGTTTYINTTTLNIGDNIITLNADLPGATAPTENAGIEINRGSSANANFIWDETNDVWASQINGISKLAVSNTAVSMTGNTYLFLGSFNGEGGEIVFANTTGGTGPIVDIDGGNDWRWSTYNNASNIKFNTGASATTKLQISANGNIGIGNTTPTETLSVTGTAQVTNSTASVFLAAANGNIGVGTTAPQYPLHIQRNANTAVAELRIDNANTGSGAQSRLNLVTASAFSFAVHGLTDGPTPQYNIGTGIGVTGGIIINAANAALTLSANSVTSLKIFANNNIAIGANSTPTDKLRVEGTLSHLGLVPSTGTGIDQIFTATPSITLNTTWQSTGVTSTNLANGSYMVQLFANDIAAGGTANNEYYTGMMSWYSADTNSTVLDEIPLHRAGVSGSNNAIFLATQRTATANTSDLLLMISSAANNSGASTYTIKFRRMI